MTKIPTLLKGFAVLVFVLLGAAVVSPGGASAHPDNPSYCDSEVDYLEHQNFGTEVPVILVHGRNGSPQDWGFAGTDTTFAGRIDDAPGVAVVHRFKYNTNNWVTHSGSGPKLAKTIDCVSRMSVAHGGQGKVVLVGYSMGGLVAREALSKQSTDGQRAIADQVGQVVTIGTPHTGIIYPFAGAWSYNSTEMQALPQFPEQTVVHTIAGDVTQVRTNLWGNETRTRPFNDTLVSTFSAHHGWTLDSEVGGGFKDITCEKRYNWLGVSQNAPCEHGQLIAWENNGVREDTIDAITKYVASLTPPQGDTTLTVGGLTFTYDERWEGVAYGASGPGWDSLATDTTNAATCTNCTTTPPPQVRATVMVINMDDFWCTGTTVSCLTGTEWPVIGTAPDVTIGGRTPDHAVRFIRGQYQGTALGWCFEAEKVCVEYDRAVDTPQLEVSDALLDIFSTATWSTP